MPRYLDTTGYASIAIAICGRCSKKLPYVSLRKDPNNGLMVCEDCCDVFDPWRLPSRKTENIALHHPRPDLGLEMVDTIFSQVVLDDGSFWITDEGDFVYAEDQQVSV